MNGFSVLIRKNEFLSRNNNCIEIRNYGELIFLKIFLGRPDKPEGVPVAANNSRRTGTVLNS